MSRVKFRNIIVKGVTFEVWVKDDGKFVTSFEESEVEAQTLEQLQTKLADYIGRKKKVSIPFCEWEMDRWDRNGGKLRTGTITGVHAANDNLLVKYDDVDKPEQAYNLSCCDPDKGQELKTLGEAVLKAQKELDQFQKKHQWDGKTKVRKALEESAGKEKVATGQK